MPRDGHPLNISTTRGQTINGLIGHYITHSQGRAMAGRKKTMLEHINRGTPQAVPRHQTLIDPAATPPPSSEVPIASPSQPSAPLDCEVYRPIGRPPMGMLTLLDDGSRKGEVIRLRANRCTVGRLEGDVVIPHDSAISARHAEILREFEDGRFRWYLRDLDSRNGTFARCVKVELRHGQEVMIGSRKLVYREGSVGASSVSAAQKHSTLPVAAISTADLEAARPALVEIMPAGEGKRYPLPDESLTIGSDPGRAQIVLPDDPFISPVHARLEKTGSNVWTLSNQNSVNGIWTRVQLIPMDGPCEFQCGEQRFRFHTA